MFTAYTDARIPATDGVHVNVDKIRKVDVIAWDGSRECLVKVEGIAVNMNKSKLYETKQHLRWREPISTDGLPSPSAGEIARRRCEEDETRSERSAEARRADVARSLEAVGWSNVRDAGVAPVSYDEMRPMGVPYIHSWGAVPDEERTQYGYSPRQVRTEINSDGVRYYIIDEPIRPPEWTRYGVSE